MTPFLLSYWPKLLTALWEHLQIVSITMVISLAIAAILTILCMRFDSVSNWVIGILSTIYSIPSLAMFSLLIPLTGLGKTTAITALVIYNQYLLLRSFVSGLNHVDEGVVNAAVGMGMTPMQVLWKIRLPLSKKALFAGLRLAVVATIGIATIAASINAGGLGTVLFDGLRTMNLNKIIWGSILSSGLAVLANALLIFSEKKIETEPK